MNLKLSLIQKVIKMKTNDNSLKCMSLEDMQSNQGGMFAWADMFWSGCKVGLGVGGAFGIAYYLRAQPLPLFYNRC